ncbi:MATE family efflux transporter [Pseudalkalibacillus sp. SCS-8]|uniref:MATE family efflux transporter n=1 Tax=Pseudalkalibacillus nanhaiensis TaxID=3115291 RepID=UPI0032DB6B9A
MYQTYTLGEKLRQFMTILLPILITQVGLLAMNFFDTVMSGRAGAEDLAGVAIGSSIWVPVFTGLSGILMALTPIVAQLIGGKKSEEVSFSVLQTVYLAIFLSFLIFLIGFIVVPPILGAMDLEADVSYIAKHYLVGLSVGILPLFIYTALRSFIDALGETRITMFITLLSLPVNILFNYLLIFGKFGFPQLGGIGAGYASAITYWFIFFVAAFVVHRVQPFAIYQVFNRFYRISIRKWIEVMKIGIPIGLSIFFEVSIFAAVTILMSRFDTITIAAHQAAINFASLLYMAPLSVSMALTIAVGFEIGGKRTSDAKQYGRLGIGIAVVFALTSAVFLWFLNDEIAGLYTKDKAVLDLTAHFLIYAIFFQLSDAVAAPIQGALRGYKDVNVTLIMALISYWVIGLPLGYVLANDTSFGPFGYWIGLSTGLTSGAVTLYLRLRFLQKKYEDQSTALAAQTDPSK